MKKTLTGLILSGAAIALAGCSSSEAPAGDAAPEGKLPSSVTYEIDGDYSFASYDDKLSNANDWPEDKTRVDAEVGDHAYVMVTGKDRSSTVTCKIVADGKVLVEKTAKGSADSAMCSVGSDGEVQDLGD